MSDAEQRSETALKLHGEALYDAGEYLIAGPENQAEWWEHLGDAHRDYAALARAAEALQATLERIAWPEFERDANGRQVGCRCGHRYEMCHAVNAARYCGGDALGAQRVARHVLGYYDDHGLITPKGQARYDALREAAR